MAPYFRFPETDSIQQRFWGFPPRNPTCGLFSFETGTKIYAWGKIICCACICLLIALLCLSPLIIHHSDKDYAEFMKNPKMIENTEWVDKIYLKQSHIFLQALLFVSFILVAIEWFIIWKLKKAVVERDLPQLKKCFFVICLLNLLSLPFYFDLDLMSSGTFLIQLPFFIFEVMGLIFTHAFIVSLIRPDYSQQDDLNRIQFNP
ncbi:hypothetical protein Ocin01_13001 [Orchesella cincta]|uniref:Transmembrane protein n=1 Tax=Orchesella cincta TaxID=48709 RepID=A0A1D2MLA4_ORCCI|nr:hypothetical protein Ocin01_13001 [Orchesella cincta]